MTAVPDRAGGRWIDNAEAVTDLPDQLADIGDRLVQCRADDEFLTQVELITRS